MTSSASSAPWQSHGLAKNMDDELYTSSEAVDTSSDVSSDDYGECGVLARAWRPELLALSPVL